MRTILCALAAVALLAQAQQTPANAEVRTVPVQGNVYLLTGAGGNITVQIGDQGVLVVDTGLAQMSDKVLAAIRKLSEKPLQYIINTHVHPDHTGGNGAIRRAGTTITGANVTGNVTAAAILEGAAVFAQDDVLQRMVNPGGNQTPAPSGAWP